VKGIFAGGDVANAPVYPSNIKSSLGHWQLATYHGKVAALQMLGKKTPIKSVPFFWTALFGTSIRFAGMFFFLFFLIYKVKFCPFYNLKDSTMVTLMF